MAARLLRSAVYRTALVVALGATATATAEEPWDSDPAVQEVLELRRQGIAAMTAGGATAATERYSSTFVANTPGNAVVTGEQMAERFAQGAISYQSVEQRLDYAGSHGPDIVVLMGEEIVVPGPNARDAGKRIRRRFTDVFRKENGEWRHDLRHANVIAVE
jgi:ketosteroid isomerase-like protein